MSDYFPPQKRTESVTLRIESGLLSTLKQTAIDMSAKARRTILYTDLLRQAVAEKYASNQSESEEPSHE